MAKIGELKFWTNCG